MISHAEAAGAGPVGAVARWRAGAADRPPRRRAAGGAGAAGSHATPAGRHVALARPRRSRSPAQPAPRTGPGLREAGAGEVLLAERDTLALHGDVEVDALHFEQALQAGEPESALALWRGAVASDLSLNESTAFDDWLASARQRWHSRWSAAVEAGAAAAENSGHLDDALSRLEQLLADDPLQERHWRSVDAPAERAGPARRGAGAIPALPRVAAQRTGAGTDGGHPGPGRQPGRPRRRRLPRCHGTRRRRQRAPPRVSVRVPDVLPFVGREAEIGDARAGLATARGDRARRRRRHRQDAPGGRLRGSARSLCAGTLPGWRRRPAAGRLCAFIACAGRPRTGHRTVARLGAQRGRPAAARARPDTPAAAPRGRAAAPEPGLRACLAGLGPGQLRCDADR